MASPILSSGASRLFWCRRRFRFLLLEEFLGHGLQEFAVLRAQELDRAFKGSRTLGCVVKVIHGHF